MTTRGAIVHDLRHRYSYELRPAPALDARLRQLATELEAAGLLLPGASTAARFHPHLTLARAATADLDAAHGVAQAMEAGRSPAVAFTHAGAFGGGRIVFVEPADPLAVARARAALVEHVAPDHLDPLVRERTDWTPHVTLAYAVPGPARDAAFAHVVAALPIAGAWGSVEVWDLDVRPTVRVHRVALGG